MKKVTFLTVVVVATLLLPHMTRSASPPTCTPQGPPSGSGSCLFPALLSGFNLTSSTAAVGVVETDVGMTGNLLMVDDSTLTVSGGTLSVAGNAVVGNGRILFQGGTSALAVGGDLSLDTQGQVDFTLTTGRTTPIATIGGGLTIGGAKIKVMLTESQRNALSSSPYVWLTWSGALAEGDGFELDVQVISARNTDSPTTTAFSTLLASVENVCDSDAKSCKLQFATRSLTPASNNGVTIIVVVIAVALFTLIIAVAAGFLVARCKNNATLRKNMHIVEMDPELLQDSKPTSYKGTQ